MVAERKSPVGRNLHRTCRWTTTPGERRDGDKEPIRAKSDLLISTRLKLQQVVTEPLASDELRAENQRLGVWETHRRLQTGLRFSTSLPSLNNCGEEVKPQQLVGRLRERRSGGLELSVCGSVSAPPFASDLHQLNQVCTERHFVLSGFW